MRRLIALALVVALTLALTAPAAEARHGHVVAGIGTAVGLALVAPFIIVGSILPRSSTSRRSMPIRHP